MYLWIKVLHIVAVISWMAGMLYLPRLFVYHAGVEPGSPQARTFEVMEYRLLHFIMTPAMAVTWIAGVALMLEGGWLAAGWLHAKLTAVVVMSAVHGLLGRWQKDFAAGRNAKSARFFRFINEVPTLLMIFIVIMVVVKPF